jgi:hypothetical protein
MSFIFGNPIVKKINEMLLEKALTEATVLFQSGKIDDIKKEANSLYKSLISDQRVYMDMSIKKYSSIASQTTQQALEIALSTTNPSWFSIEIVDKTKDPFVLVIPYKVLQLYVIPHVSNILSTYIEFKGLSSDSISIFADDAVSKYFNICLRDAIRKQKKFDINLRFNQKLYIVDLIKDDLYFLDEDDKPCRIYTIVLSQNDTAWWKKMIKDITFRPQGRRFTTNNFQSWKLINFDINSIKQ